MRTFSHAWHVPLALISGAAIASNPRFFPAESSPGAPVVRTAPAVPVTGPSPDIVAGLQTGRSGPESPELRALRLAEAQLFADDAVGQDADWGDDLGYRADEDPDGARRSRVRADAPDSDFSSGVSPFEGLILPELGNVHQGAVAKYMRYFTRSPKGREILSTWLGRSGRYRPIFGSALSNAGVPVDLEAVAFIESGLWPTAKSPAGAVGLWQFMPATARAYGLTVSRDYDERRSIWKSSEAAAQHLADLHARFNSWELALAAYNNGYGNIEGALERTGTEDFWSLAASEGSLPDETRKYVPKVLAVAVVLRNLDQFGFEDVQIDPAIDAVAFEVPPGTSLKTLARAAGMSAAELKQLNPEFLTALVPDRGSPIAVHIPRGGLARAKTMLPRLLGGPVRELDEQVSDQFDWGRDTPDAVGQNRLERTRLSQRPLPEVSPRPLAEPEEPRAGRPLACETMHSDPSEPNQSKAPSPEEDEALGMSKLAPEPPRVALSQPSELSLLGATIHAEAPTFITYVVNPGDTLEKIAKRHAVSQEELILDNKIRDRSVVYRGQTLKVRDTRTSPIRTSLLYRVQPGDTLSSIAARAREHAERIAQRNGIHNPNHIEIGQIVILTQG
jgi:membrane-bound lytic murein transglycosylase D